MIEELIEEMLEGLRKCLTDVHEKTELYTAEITRDEHTNSMKQGKKQLS